LIFAFLLSCVWATQPISCPSFDIPVDIDSDAPYIYLIDHDSGLVLLERNGERLMHPSSMTKIMTTYLAMKKLESGQIKHNMEFTVSRNAWKREGSSMFLQVDTNATLEELLHGIVIQSGNDASVVLAEGICGSEAAYAAEMTRLAHKMGAIHTNFMNATGIPDDKHLTTPKDLALISMRLIEDFPNHYKLYSQKEYTYNKIKQGNRNPLLYKNIGCDGIKTGSSSKGGYGMVASSIQKGRRLILVINGLRSMQSRADESMKLMTWGFQTFNAYPLFEKHQEVGRLRVFYGEKDELVLHVQKRLAPLIAHSLRNNLVVKSYLPKAIKGPVKKDQVVGYIQVSGKGFKTPYKVNVIASQDVRECGFIKHIRDSLVLLFGKE
jgi:D-alanyl-D-alanine carboxypeptidase (penicillin-binding protein 5/6)